MVLDGASNRANGVIRMADFAYTPSVESYQHLFAKRLLVQWLREAAEESSSPIATLPPFKWQINGPKPIYAVWEEYPVCDESITSVWCERDDAYHERPPTYEECLSLGLVPEVIFDIAVQHKGAIVYGIEVVHKNDISPEKMRRLQGYYGVEPIEVYRVEAGWIMSQVKRPEKIKCTRLI